MNTWTIENIKTINKIQKQSKVIESIKRNKREKIDVKIENLKQFIIDNRYNIENFKFDYHNNQWEKRTIEKRLFTNWWYIYYFKKGSSKWWYKVDFSNYKNLKITSIMKSW